MKKALTFSLILLLSYSCGTKQTAEETTSPEEVEISHHIDHVIVAINNLDSGIAKFERLTGITPVVGGEHPGRGTHNALVSLGNNTYLEIIAPRQNLDSAEYSLSEYLLVYDELTPTGWAINTSEPSESREIVANSGFSTTDLREGGRIKPDGTELSWTTFGIVDELSGKPFFIKWGEGSAHPSTTSPAGVSLKGLTITSPNADKLSALMKGLGLDILTEEGAFVMSLELETPDGNVSIVGEAYNDVTNPN